MNEAAPLPRYITLAEELKDQMYRLAPNVLLPSEDQLAKQFSVSRVTLRRALQLLELAGLVYRQRGRGTLVSSPKVIRTLFPTLPIEEDIRQQGLTLHTELLGVSRQKPDEHIRAKLRCPARSLVAVISLIRKVDGRVICFDQRFVAEPHAEKLDVSKIGKVPIATLIAACDDRPVKRHDWKLEFSPSGPEAAKVLGVTPDALIVISSGIDYLEDATPLSMGIVHYRIDRVNFACSGPYSPNAIAAPLEEPK